MNRVGMVDSASQLLDPLAERYLSQLRVEGGLATNTLESYRRDLTKFQQYLSQHQLRMGTHISPQTVAGFLSSLKQAPLAASSIARIVSAMRGWFRFSVRDPGGNLIEIAERKS